MSPADKTNCAMTDSKLLPLALLYTERRAAVEGATRFQKLVFLAQQETDLPESFAFHASNFGPYSYELENTLETLEKRGYVERRTETNAVGNEKHIFALTQSGLQIAQRMLKKPAYEPLFERAAEIKSQFNSDTLGDLLRYVYGNYPEYATETQLDTERLFDPAAESQFLEVERRDPDYLGAGPIGALEKNSSAADFF